MGFMDLTVRGSDKASDFYYLLTKEVAKVLEKELKNEANQYNTPGWINVAMIFDESLINAFPGKTDCGVADELVVIGEKVVKIITAFQKSKEGDWEKRKLTSLKVRIQNWVEKNKEI